MKDRGATIIVITTCENLGSKIDINAFGFLIELFPHKSMLASMLCVPPILMICYYTALMKGINPDENIVDAINFYHKE